MAEIVLGIGTSHGPMLSTPPERWFHRANGDRKNPRHPFRNKVYTFDELEALRAGENLEAKVQPDVQQKAFDACQAAIAKLGDVFAEVKPDVCVIMGNDQMEMFWSGVLPAFSVYWGDGIENRQPPAEIVAKMDPGFLDSISANAPPEPAVYPGQPQLGLHILKSLQKDGFDITSVQKIPPHKGDWTSISHAYGFVFRKIMRDAVPPTVPVIQNTFFQPNQPTVSRCIALGKALVQAIKSWDSDARVCLIASGGLSHFVIDEEVDAVVIDALKTNQPHKLEALSEETFQSGTSEIKNWIPVAGAMADLGFEMNLVDYVPCYRSTAGTGNAMGFVYWQPPKH